MKFLVSDYDGTLKSDINNLKINISAINEFRKKGNHFAIATGRSYESIKNEINKYNINYDYLITNDGAITFDKFDNILNAEMIDSLLLKELCNYIYSFKKYKNKLNVFTIPNSNEIIELQLLTSIFSSLKDLDDFLNKNPEIQKTNLKIFPFKFTFLKKYCNKSSAINKLINLLNNNYEDIITVGDASNDIEMLKDYNGYKMFFSYPCLLKHNFKVTKEVHKLIKKL